MSQYTGRRQRMRLGTFQLTLLHYTNPWVTAAWSCFMPGFGHLLLGQYALGWTLFVWEVVINVQSHFNTAIFYTFTGRFHEAAQVLQGNIKYWILTYGALFVFTAYHSFTSSVDANHLYYLANKENAHFAAFSINQVHYNYLAKRSPIVGAVWSLLIPGVGGIYTNRILTSIFEITWWSVILIKSHFLISIEYTAIGSFDRALKILDPEWTLFLPSMFAFPFYLTYVATVERNKLFDKEQANYLVQNYQCNKQFPLSSKDDVRKMRFVAAFNHSFYLEKAITALETIGVFHEDIFVAPLDKRNRDSTWLDTAKRSDGKSLLDAAAILGALGCFFGTVYGFILPWGPVMWGLIGFVGGCLMGGLLKLFTSLFDAKRHEKGPKTEVVLIVDCDDDLGRKVQHILWSNKCFGVSRIDPPSP